MHIMSFRHHYASLLVPLALGLASCAGTPTDFKFDPARNTGLVVGSISYEGGLGRYVLVAKDKSTGAIVSFNFGCTLVPCFTSTDDEKFSKGEVPKQRGGGFAAEVPAGEYQIVAWQIVQGAKRSTSTSPIDIPLMVEKGKASYVGNLHFDAHWENIQLRDKVQRDLPLLQAQYPVLEKTPLAYSIAAGTSIEKLGGSYQSRIKFPVIIPIVR
jgi:hypothetical protein